MHRLAGQPPPPLAPRGVGGWGSKGVGGYKGACSLAFNMAPPRPL